MDFIIITYRKQMLIDGSGHIHHQARCKTLIREPIHIFWNRQRLDPYTPPAELAFPGEGSLHISARELNEQ